MKHIYNYTFPTLFIYFSTQPVLKAELTTTWYFWLHGYQFVVVVVVEKLHPTNQPKPMPNNPTLTSPPCSAGRCHRNKAERVLCRAPVASTTPLSANSPWPRLGPERLKIFRSKFFGRVKKGGEPNPTNTEKHTKTGGFTLCFTLLGAGLFLFFLEGGTTGFAKM